MRKIEPILKITNVLADPTRYHIYQFISKHHAAVTVQEIADAFDIHPNVARLHLGKLEDVNMLVSETQKTGKGGRPGRIYKLSDELISLQFPFRDYQMLAKIAIEAMAGLGEAGKVALLETGKKFGQELVQQQLENRTTVLSFGEKMAIFKNASNLLGLNPEFEVNLEQTSISFNIYNCPFKEIAKLDKSSATCSMHGAFIQGMFQTLFQDVTVTEQSNMLNSCSTCSYLALVTN